MKRIRNVEILMSYASLITVIYIINTFERLTNSISDPDLWGYLAFGRYFWKLHSIPYQDVFSYTPTLCPWVYHEWLTGVLFFPIYQTFGPVGMQILKYLIALLTISIIYWTARKRGADHFGIIVVLFIIQGFLSIGYSPVRAQIFTWAFFVLTLYLLETAKKNEKYEGLWLLIPIQVIWCNLHGGFLSGLGLVGIYAIGEFLKNRPIRPYLTILLLSGLATLINPYGLAYWEYLFSAITMERPEITEWVSALGALQKGVFGSELFYLVNIFLFSLLLFAWSPGKEITPFIALGLTLYLGLRHMRHLVFFFILIGAYLPLPVSTLFDRIGSDPKVIYFKRRLGLKIPTLFIMIVLVYYSYLIGNQNPLSLNVPAKLDPKAKSSIYYPVGAVDYIKEKKLKGNLLGEFNWGEYLIWNLYPQCKISLDGRYETVYPKVVCKEYFDFIDGRPTWRKFIEKYGHKK